MIAAVGDDITLRVAGWSVCKAHYPGRMDAGRTCIEIGGILHVYFTPVMDAVYDASIFLCIQSSDKSYMKKPRSLALIEHRGIARDIAHGSIVYYAGNHTCAKRNGHFRGNRQRTTVFYYEVLHDAPRADISEDPEVLSSLGLFADKVQVFNMMSVAVELAGKGISAHHCGEIVLPRSRGIPHRHEIRHSGKVKVGEQIHPAFFVLPFRGGFACIDSNRKCAEILHVVYSRGFGFIHGHHYWFFLAPTYCQGNKG